MSTTPSETPDAGPRAGSPSPSAPAGIPRALMLLIGAAAIVVTIAGLQIGAWLIAPILLALVVVIAVSPIQAWMRRRGLPPWSTVLALVVVIFGVIVGLVWVLLASVGQLIALLPQYADRVQGLTGSVTRALNKLGFDPAHARSAASSADLSKVLPAIEGVLSGLSGALTSIVFILALLLFLIAEAGGAARRLEAIGTDRPHMVDALQRFASGTRSYLVVTAVFGLIVAVLDSVALAIMGIPLVVLWGLLSFITNFIPNIGFIIGVIPPALLGLLTGGWQTGLAVVVVYCVLNAVVQSLIQPHFTGDAVGLSTVVTFVALLFWAWVLGPLGALLAIPATLLIKAVLVDCDPSAAWVEALIGSGESDPGKRRKRRRRTKGTGTDETADDEGTGASQEPADEPVADLPPPAITTPTPRTAPAP